MSARDRTRTVHSLASPDTRPEDLRRPGHVFPLRARPGGVLERDGHTEASVDLVRMAGCCEVAVITELVADNGVPMSGQTLAAFAVEHNIPMITIADLIEHRRNTETTVRFGGSANLPPITATSRYVPTCQPQTASSTWSSLTVILRRSH
ncbi:3,4-dihydroxy-2-butanone-4-phosphate synthase [Rhodococcus opacus]|nr:3,4-dihydroxy-2-butanone-4-phosphate synthase [Rhodococcus opacus]